MNKIIASMAGTIASAALALLPMPFQQWANLRVAGAVGGVGFAIAGCQIADRKKQKQLAIDKWNFAKSEEQRLISEATRPVVIETAVKKLANQAEYALADHRDDCSAAYTTLMIEKYGEEWVRSQLPQPEPEQVALPEPELKAIVEDVKQKKESFAAKKAKLLKFLKEHEGGWILKCLKKPLLIYGGQGSGKSYFAEFIALCRYYLRDHEIVSIADPHFHQNKDECWFHLSKLGVPGFGAHHNYAEVNSQLLSMYDSFALRTLKSAPQTRIFDEITRYKEEEDTRESAAKLGSKLSSDVRKANCSPIVIAHGTTLAILGGADGFAEAINENFIKLKLNSNDEQEPLWRGTISGIKDDDGETIVNMKISIAPEWIRSSWVYDLFNSDDKEISEIADTPIEPKKELKADLSPESLDAAKFDRMMQGSDRYLAESTPEFLAELKKKWLEDTTTTEVEVTSTTTPWDEATEVLEARNSSTSAITSIVPEDVRSKALTRILTLLSEVGSASDEVINLMPSNPDKAVWIGIKLLGKSMTATSRDIFEMGTGGAKFKIAKAWYESLKNEFDRR